MEIREIVVIGAGQMGNGICQVAAMSGYQVTMIDVNNNYLENGMATIKKSLEKLVTKEKLSSEDADLALSKIEISTEKNACRTADIIIEAIPEIPELKFSTFSELSKICKQNAILASNTSSISIDEIANCCDNPESVIGMHFMNPVPIMKLVEVINGSQTSSEVTSTVIATAENMGKTALCVNDSPGFISNRILCPMINEAIICLEEGVAEPEAIDGIMKLGMNHPIGPLALADLIGLDTVLHIMNVLHSGLGNEKYKPANLLENMVSDGKLGRKSGSGFYSY